MGGTKKSAYMESLFSVEANAKTLAVKFGGAWNN